MSKAGAMVLAGLGEALRPVAAMVVDGESGAAGPGAALGGGGGGQPAVGTHEADARVERPKASGFRRRYAPAHEADEETAVRAASVFVAKCARDAPAHAPAREAHRRPAGPDVDVRAIRAGMRLTQAAFASRFGLPVTTLRDWEHGRSAPDMAARVLLMVIEHRPEAVREALAR